MALAVFPSDLPAPTPTGYGTERAPNVDRTDMDQGRARQRLRFTDVPTTLAVQWEFTWDQYRQFDTFVVYEANYGAAIFRMPTFTHDQFETQDVRFVEPPKAVYAGWNRWRVQAEIEILSPTITDADKATLEQSISEYVLYSDMRVVIGSLPANHTVTQVEVRILEPFNGTGGNLFYVGFQASTPADEYVDQLSVALPTGVLVQVLTVTPTTAAPPRGAQLGIADTSGREVVCDHVDTNADASNGRALVVVRYTEP